MRWLPGVYGIAGLIALYAFAFTKSDLALALAVLLLTCSIVGYLKQ